MTGVKHEAWLDTLNSLISLSAKGHAWRMLADPQISNDGAVNISWQELL